VRAVPTILCGLALASALGCGAELEPGELGTPRYFAELRGAAPLRLAPPASDREGNVYVLAGSSELPDLQVFLGRGVGGWTACPGVAVDGERGVHGVVGRGDDRVYAWAGLDLFELRGAEGSCRPLLERDPVTSTDLGFLAVVPMLDREGDHGRLLALVSSPADRTPFFAALDPDAELVLGLHRFAPAAPVDLEVLGSGAAPDDRVGVVVVAHGEGDARVAEVRWIDHDAREVGAVAVAGWSDADGPLDGFLAVAGGAVAGRLRSGRLLVADEASARVVDSPDLAVAGVQAWDGALWAVGDDDGRPVVAAIDGDGVGAPIAWTASERIGAALAGDLVVLDERSPSRRFVTWSGTTSAVGELPLVHPGPLDPYALDVTGMLIAGPTRQVAGETWTSIAFAPVGVGFP
jgi:hypothetical protein